MVTQNAPSNETVPVPGIDIDELHLTVRTPILAFPVQFTISNITLAKIQQELVQEAARVYVTKQIKLPVPGYIRTRMLKGGEIVEVFFK